MSSIYDFFLSMEHKLSSNLICLQEVTEQNGYRYGGSNDFHIAQYRTINLVLKSCSFYVVVSMYCSEVDILKTQQVINNTNRVQNVKLYDTQMCS